MRSAPSLDRPRHAASVALLALSLAACTRPAPATGAPAAAVTAPPPAAPAARTAAAGAPTAPPAATAPTGSAAPSHFGAPLRGAAASTLAAVVEHPDDFAGKTVAVDGRVRANCTRKGCWMELASGMDEAAPGCRVTFRDYGFFVPVASRGAAARVEGEVLVRSIPPAEVAHLESEGGHFPTKLADGSAREVRLVADGVDLWRVD